MDITTGLIGAASLAVAAVLLWGLVNGLRKVLGNRARLPFFNMLERRGLTLTQVEEAVGMNQLARALRRCAHCGTRQECGRHIVDCPNEPLFRRAKGLPETSP